MFSTDKLWSGRELGIEATTLGVIFFLQNMELSSFEAHPASRRAISLSRCFCQASLASL